MDNTENRPQPLELSDILRAYAASFIESHDICNNQLKAINDIVNCRTSNMNGHLKRCDHCGHHEQSYNSCRNRHCNKCQFMRQSTWVDHLKGKLLPGRYFHVVFTIPESLNKLFYVNQAICYNLIFKAAWSALDVLCRNPRFLGARTGAVAILHTWTSTMLYHPHIHFLVPSGGLSDDGMEWAMPRGKYLVPVTVLSKLFRAKCADELKRLMDKRQLRMPEGMDKKSLKQAIYGKEWVVFTKDTGNTSDHVLEYLARYTHRVAIGNNRITKLENGEVTFRCKDPKTGKYNRTITLDVIEFIRRFLQHILPNGFYKIRYFGILSPACMPLMNVCRALIGDEQYFPRLEGLPIYDLVSIITGKDPSICKICREGRMLPVFNANAG